jgi:chemotaxis protein CheX
MQQWLVLMEIAAREVFEMMVGGELVPCASEGPNFGDITAMIGLAGDLCGLVTIQCSSTCAVDIGSAMLGSPVGLDDGALDALGEVCNMVAGNFKAKIAGLSDGCVLSVPTVIRGSDYELHPVGEGQSVETRQSFNGSRLLITLAIHQ